MLNWKRASDLTVTSVLRMGKNAVMKIVGTDGSESTIDLTELAALDAISATDLQKIDGITNGTGAANKAVVLDASGGATIPGLFALSGNTLSTPADTGITGGTGTVYETSIVENGGIIHTSIIIDITGLHSTGAGDIIGVDGTANACHLGQITAADNGTILGVKMTCLEDPAGGNGDIDLHSATEATGVEDAAITSLTNTSIVNGGSLTAGQSAFGNTIAADQYLYLVAVGATDADYTAGRFLIEMWGYDA